MEPLVLDKALRHGDAEILAIPRKTTVADFERFTSNEVDLLVERAAAKYHSLGLVSSPANSIVALIGPSDLDYIVSTFALSRLGFGVFTISPRLAPQQCQALLQGSGCLKVVQSGSPLAYDLGHMTQKLDPGIDVIPMIDEGVYRSGPDDRSSRNSYYSWISDDERHYSPAIIQHSSGSTGLPKAIYYPHKEVLLKFAIALSGATVCPLYHALALRTGLNAMIQGQLYYFANPHLSMTSDSLVEYLQATKAHIFWAVPHNLKVVTETSVGLDLLRSFKAVISSGSPLSSELGDQLAAAGVQISLFFASSEAGVIGFSLRPPGDMAWDYVRIDPASLPYLMPKPVGDNEYEFVFLPGWPRLNATNSSDPPGSFHSRDVFTPHPTIPRAWKFVYRLDDRVTLSTGVKVLPLPLEGRIRQELLVKEAVVFGLNRAVPGLLLFRSEAAKDMDDDTFVESVWPAIQDANAQAETFGRIMRNMIVPIPAGTPYPVADKGSIMRSRLNKAFEAEIEAAYQRLEHATTALQGHLVLDPGSSSEEIQLWLMQRCQADLGLDLVDEDSNLYEAGCDSLRATQLSSLLRSVLPSESAPRMSLNTIYTAGTVRHLTPVIMSMLASKQVVHTGGDADQVEVMRAMIVKHSHFEKPIRAIEKKPTKKVILLTGATGSLGAHLLDQLSQAPDISKIYCLVRGKGPAQRIQQSINDRGLELGDVQLVSHAADLARSDFGLAEADLSSIREEVTHIIHSAWPVNFTLNLATFEPHVQGLHNLLQLSLDAQARLFFCSSVSAALATSAPATIAEAPIQQLSQALPSGYGRSKLVSEHVLLNAVTSASADAQILRIGQVVGDTKSGIWNDNEAWPLIIRSALTLGVLPELDLTCSWLPVDTLASTMIELLSASSGTQVFNLEHPHTFHWTHDLLPLLHKMPDWHFEAVPTAVWLTKLRKYANETPADEALAHNPAIKLLEYFEQTFGHRSGTGDIVFDTAEAQKQSAVLRNAEDVIVSGVMCKIMEKWTQKWRTV